jgi:hypothetical protein
MEMMDPEIKATKEKALAELPAPEKLIEGPAPHNKPDSK